MTGRDLSLYSIAELAGITASWKRKWLGREVFKDVGWGEANMRVLAAAISLGKLYKQSGQKTSLFRHSLTRSSES